MEITVNHVSKTIKGISVLEDVDLKWTGGKVYGLQGPNGSGKTMLMRLVTGLISPTSGQVLIDGYQLGRDIDFPPSVGLLIENPGFLPNYTGIRNLTLLAEIKNIVTDKEIKKSLEDVGLDPGDKRKYRKYSLGMKQRLGIAAAIMERPDLIVLDEPTNALDDKGVEQICAIIRRERERGALVVLTCHDATILDHLSDEVYSVSEGHVERRGTR